MRDGARQTRRALLGAGISVVLLALGTGIFLLDDIIAAFRSSYDVVAVLPEAPRLAAGARVWVSGSDVGEVREVGLLPATGDSAARVAVVLRLPGRVREQVRSDSEVRLTSVNVMGAPVIDIASGSARARILRPGDTLHAAPAPDGAAVLARAASFRTALDSALVELQALRGPAEQRLEGFQRVWLQLAAAQSEYERLRSDLRASPLLNGLQTGELQASVQRGSEAMGALLAGLQQVQRRADASAFTAGAAGLGQRVAALQASLAALQDSMRVRGGTLDRLGRDSALVHAIAAARAELDSLLADVRRRPFRYVF